MKKKLEIDNWSRKEHFYFFKQFTEPFFGVCINIDCTKAYKLSKEKGLSFFLYYLHKSLLAVNNVEAFRYRIIGEEVFIYDRIDASATISRPNGTFGFSYMNFERDFSMFYENSKIEIARVKNTTDLVPAHAESNVIYYTSLPWINFTSLSHPRKFSFDDSCPRIAFGKMTDDNGKKIMPVSIHVHHALMDGFHISQFIDNFQELMNNE